MSKLKKARAMIDKESHEEYVDNENKVSTKERKVIGSAQ